MKFLLKHMGAICLFFLIAAVILYVFFFHLKLGEPLTSLQLTLNIITLCCVWGFVITLVTWVAVRSPRRKS
ncbi:MAG: hypothetical protein ACO2ZM_03190 [Francisellaceae bacterium]